MVPTVRSAIMIGVYELAVLLDREEEVFASLTFAALIIALIWPAVIADISFQLSFLAVLFIVWGMRRMMDGSSRRPRDELPQERSWWKHKLQQGRLHLAVPLFATLGTGAADRSLFRSFVIGRFISNPVIVPLVGFIVVPLGLVTGFLSLILPSAAGFWCGPPNIYCRQRFGWSGCLRTFPSPMSRCPCQMPLRLRPLFVYCCAFFFA